MIFRVERIDEKLKALPKPGLENVTHLFLEPEDTLILAAGFEDRCLGSLQYMEASGSKDFTAILINYKPRLEENRIPGIKQSLGRMAARVEEMTYDRYNPSGGGEVLVEKLENLGRTGIIYLDISAMSRFFIVQALAALGKSDRGFSDTRVLYSEARKYPPDQTEVDKEIEKNGIDSIYRTMFISAGVYEVTIVPELSSVALYGQPVRLIAFPSFNIDQLASLRGEIQPFSFNFIHGIPPAPENAWRPEAIKKLNHTGDIKINKQDLEASTLYYEETLEHLLKIYDEYNYLERIFIAPTGSKMQTVAVGIFRTFMNDVQIVYPIPREFTSPKNYTEGIKNIYSLDLEIFNSIRPNH